VAAAIVGPLDGNDLGAQVFPDELGEPCHRPAELAVVAFSVIVQGGLVPVVAARLGVPMRTVEPEPWSLGVRFRHEPQGLHRHVVAAGSPADGCRIGDLDVGEDVWISSSAACRHMALLDLL
jgi:hypothetical protein